MEETDKLIKDLNDYLASSDVDNALKLVGEPNFQQCFSDSCWELITTISSHINDKILMKDKKLFECCENLMNVVAEKCPPEESLLQVIDQVESLNDVRFVSLLTPMQKIVLRIESKLGLSVEWCFNSIHRHLESLPLPENEDLEEEELKLLDSDPCVLRIVDLYTAIIPFYEPFIDKLNSSTMDDKNKDHLKDAILSSCFRFLGKPLIFMDLEYDGKSKSSVRCISEKVIEMIYKVNPDLISVLQVRDLTNILADINRNKDEFQKDCKPKDNFPVEDKYSSVTLGVYCYLIFGEHVYLDTIPQVYNPLFILDKNVYLSGILLKAPYAIIQKKGLILVKGTLERFADFTVPSSQLESPTYRHVIEGLYSSAVYSYQKRNRQLAVALIKDLVFKFDITGRYIILVKMVKLANHSGIIGYLAMLFKDVLADVLSRPKSECEFYTEKRVCFLLGNFCDLPNKAQSDLVELSDQVISSLNLIRYIVIRDTENRTGIKTFVKILDKHYFKYLMDGINLSRAHYKLKLEEVQSEKKKRKSMSPSRSTSIFIGNNKVPNLPIQEKLFIIQSALNGFDVMESLLCRLKECIAMYVK